MSLLNNRIMTMIWGIIFSSIIFSCTESENIDINNNKLPKYKSISTLRIENYVQRMFIDLLGRESTNQERDSFTAQLKRSDLHDSCRTRLVRTLLYDTTYHVGDSSYRHAFAQRIYDISKARFLEGASDPSIAQFVGNLDFAIAVARLEGDSTRVYLYYDYRKKYFDVLNSRILFRKNLIDYRQMTASMINNSIYDGINMNSFNFVNAAFDNVLSRKPTGDEFSRSFDIIEKNLSRSLFGRWATNKNEFCQVLTESDAFHEGQIRWFYYVMVQREPTTAEVSKLFFPFIKNHRIEEILETILITDEYAQFE
ncbi:MAG: hypothetical protein RL041_1086 [Bacteroidota bacterium]